MRVIEVGGIRTNVLPKHHDVFAREIRGPESGDKKVTVLHNVLLAHGSAEMHVHPESEHIFYVLRGELQVSDGKKALVKARLHKRLRALGLHSYGQYVERVCHDADGAETAVMLDALSTNLTYFFRLFFTLADRVTVIPA